MEATRVNIPEDEDEEVGGVGGDGTQEEGDKVPASEIPSGELGFHPTKDSPIPSTPQSFQRCIDKFVGYFRARESTESTDKTYAQVVKESTRSMVHPAANCGGMRRDEFGAGRSGRGAGRIGRNNVWQRTGRSIPEERKEGEFDSSQDRGDLVWDREENMRYINLLLKRKAKEPLIRKTVLIGRKK